MNIPEKDYDGFSLILSNKGLFEREWDRGKKREYKVRKVTKTQDIFRCLDKHICIEEGTRLEAVFKLLASDDAYKLLSFGFPNSWVMEYVNEYLRIKSEKEPIKKWSAEYSDKELEYLELHWWFQQDEDYFKRYGDKKVLHGLTRPDFHGMSFEYRETVKDEWGTVFGKKGQRMGYAIEFSPIQDLLNIPLRLNHEVKLYDDDTFKYLGKKYEWVSEFTLYQVIYGIFWELSFCGGPAGKVKENDKLKKVMDEVDEAIKSGDMSKFVEVDLNQLDRIGELFGDKNKP